MATQKEIAELAGVSRGTVDRVLNNRGEVNNETRRKVMEIARLMDYKPNRAGKTLVIRQKHLKIGCIMIKADNPFYAELIQGIQERTEEYKSYGIEIILKLAAFEAASQIKKINELLDAGINALVIQPANESSLLQKLQEVSSLGIPIVTTNTDLPGFDSFCYIGNDFYTCGKTAANIMALITQNHATIGIVTGFKNAKSHSDRIDGFKDYITNISQMNIATVVSNHDDELESYRVTTKMLMEHPEIDSVFIVAGGVYGAGRAIKEISSKRHLTTISFDDVPTTKELIEEGIIQATICQQPKRQGELSLEVLFNYFLDQCPPEKHEIYTDIQIKLKSNINS
jgi:LacI family transcriptional regulator